MTTSRDVGYSFMGPKPLNCIGNSDHRIIKLFGDGVVTFMLTILGYYLLILRLKTSVIPIKTLFGINGALF